LPKASVVVPTFNRCTLLPRVLEALLTQDYEGDYEVVVVDDGSRDATPQVLQDWVRRHPSCLRVFRQDNAGPARARNRGAHEARGPFLVFIDDDCVAERSWLRSLDRALEHTGAAAIGGAVINAEKTWVGRYVNCERVIDHVVSPHGVVEELITSNAGVRADVFRQLGGFDEAIRVAGGEDTEFSLRLRATGLQIAAAPDARVHHESRVDLRGYLRMIYRHGRGRRRLGARFPVYRLCVPRLRLAWLTWPIRLWVVRDYLRYRHTSVPRGEALRYVSLRYLENIVRMAGYIRGSS
jgi:GT2 family glycosyltransferase